MISKIINTQSPDVLDVRWAMSNVCNYKCRYCFPGSNEGNYKFPKNVSLLIKNFEHMFDHYENRLGKTKFHLKILGGEPTLWPELDIFIKAIKEKHNVYVSIITNGSRTLRWWQENGQYIDNICISYHKQQSDINHIISVADTMYMFDKKVTVHVLMDHKVWDECVADVSYMKQHSKYPWMIQTKKITPTNAFVPAYTVEQDKFMQRELKRIPSFLWLIKQFKLVLDGSIRLFESKYIKNHKTYRATAEHYVVSNQTKFNGYECNMGIESIYVDWDGRLTSSCGQTLFDGMFNILDNDFSKTFSPQFNPVVCQQQNCWCPSETHVSKKYIKLVPVSLMEYPLNRYTIL